MSKTFKNWWTALIHILAYNYKLFTKGPDYPLSIIPKRKFKVPISFDDLVEIGGFVVVHRSSKQRDETFDEFGFLRDDAISVERIPNLSMNILGGKFKVEHLKHNAKKPASNDWVEGERISLYEYQHCIEVVDPCSPIFFKLNDLHGKVFPYKRPVNDKEVKRIVAALYPSTPIDNGKYKFEGISSVEHKPTKLNYWHVELKLKDVQKNEIKNVGSAWRKSVAEHIFTDIMKVKAEPYIAESEHYTIPSCFYYNK